MGVPQLNERMGYLENLIRETYLMQIDRRRIYFEHIGGGVIENGGYQVKGNANDVIQTAYSMAIAGTYKIKIKYVRPAPGSSPTIAGKISVGEYIIGETLKFNNKIDSAQLDLTWVDNNVQNVLSESFTARAGSTIQIKWRSDAAGGAEWNYILDLIVIDA